jgi:CheY-like chemotaxis protein
MKKEKDFREKDLVQIRISLPEGSDSIIMSDKSRLRQVFTNLLSNALKFTNEGYVEIGYTTREGSVQFFVRDTGIGIEPEKHDIIFERFRQAEDSYTRKYGGTGLGLAISRQIVGLLGGEIWLESSPGQGSTFWFSVPLKSTERAQNNLPDMADVIAARDLNLENRKILIAEDDPSNYLFLESFLSRLKAELIWARDGHQVIEMYRKNKDLDLIIMDIRMPAMNGLEATEKIRKTDPDIPIIALTAFAFAEDRVRSVQAGCNEHLSKPVKVDELKILLSRYIKTRKPD